MKKFDWHQTRFDSLSALVHHNNIAAQHIDGKDDRCEMTSWQKSQFRKSIEWKQFCKNLIEKLEGKCERCNCDGADQVHHRNPKQYSDLTPENFVLLCGRCHLQIEAMCKTEESMKRSSRVDRRFLTLYPYIETNHDVLAKGSGYFWKRQVARELDATKNPGKWMNVKPMSEERYAEVVDALKFMKEHKELF